MALLLAMEAPLLAQSPGLDAPVAVGAFLNGVLPPHTPHDPANVQWDIVPAFPNIALTDPLVIVTNPADNRLYVGSREGNIVSFENDPSASTTTPFLDLRDRVAVVWDGGFLGMAFHPEFGTPGSPHRGDFFVYYSSYCPIDATGEGVDLAACNPAYARKITGGFFGTWLRLSRFTIPDDETVPDPASERVMLNIRLYNSSHRGGGMLFTDDGYFWLTIGDQFRYWSAQDIVSTLEGGILRLDVDVIENEDGSITCPVRSHAPIRAFGRPDPTNPLQTLGQPDEVSGQLYCVPNDNPWLSPAGAAFEEYATVGHRNPHRMTKDSATGRLWSGEIGESSREEINVIEIGHNYGWPYREGTIAGGTSPPTTPILGGRLTDPVIDFVRSDASAIIGGYVYNGSRFPELRGRYLAGDHLTRKVFAIALDEINMKASATQLTTFDPGALGGFGQDENGEVFFASVAKTGPLFTLARITTPVPDPPPLLSQLGAFTQLDPLTPASFLVPYDLNEPFWSDGARKSRWIAVPNDGARDTPAEQVTYKPDGDWGFPTGTVLMKHFELPLDENNPDSTTRLETRFLVRGDDARWYGLTYRWRLDQSDADLLTAEASDDYAVALAGGGTRMQTWHFPSRGQCLSCHNAGTSGALGVRTHQLDRDFTYPSTGRTDNQLATWSHLGMLSPAPDPAALGGLLRSRAHDDPTASLEDRARSWLDANCSQCHRPGTGNGASFDARLTTPLFKQGLVYGAVLDDLGIPDASVVTPWSPELSILCMRASSVNTWFAMPPLAKSLVDIRGTELLDAWVRRLDPRFPSNGVAFEYYEIPTLPVLPNFDALTPKSTGTAATFDISFRQREDNFAFRFRGFIQIDVAGDYTFYTNSDDGSRLYIDGALVVDNDGGHGKQERSGPATLTAGVHAIQVTFFDRGGSEALLVNYSGPGIAKQLIPTNLLFVQPPVAPEDDPPSLVNPGAQTSSPGVPASLALAGFDPDDDDLWFEASGLPPGLSLDRETGVIAGAPTAPGLYSVIAGVSDGPAVDSQTFEWLVEGATHTPKSTRTRTAPPRPTPSPTSTSTPAPTATATRVASATATASPTTTHTEGPPRSATRTATFTRSPTRTRTPTVTRSATMTRTATRTATATKSRTRTRTPTWTRSATPTRSATRTATRSRTPTRTRTRTPTRSATPTRTPFSPTPAP